MLVSTALGDDKAKAVPPLVDDNPVPTLHIYPEDVEQDSIIKWSVGTNKVVVRWTYTEAGARKALAFWEAHVNQKFRTAVGSFVSRQTSILPEEPTSHEKWKKGWVKSRTDKFYGVTEIDAEAIVAGLKKK